LDRSTPRWPQVDLVMTDPPSITVCGVSTALTGDDPQRDAVIAAARQARLGGRPIRMRVATGAGVQRVIVTGDHRVVPLPTPDQASQFGAGKTPAAAAAKTRPAAPRRRALDRFPRPVRWAGLALAVLTGAALVVIVAHDKAPAAAAAVEPAAPPAPAGRLYTELAPAGWSQEAGWVLPVVGGTIPATDPATGVSVAVTAADRSTPDTAAQRVGPKDRWLSVLEPDGRTRFAAALDDAPRFGPVITRVDGATVALIGTADQLRYWPVTGGPGTDIDLPSGAHLDATGESVLLTLPGDRLGYLHAGAVQTLPTLPRTTPAIALDGAAVVTQPDTGAWWTLRVDTAPTSIRPAAPPGAAAVQSVLAVTATHVLIAWAPAARDSTRPPTTTPTVIVAGYDRGTGRLLATDTAPASAVQQVGAAVRNDTAGLTAAGPVLLSTPPAGPATVTVAPGFTATAAADHVYGTLDGKPAVLGGDAAPTLLPAGTLTPTGAGPGFLPVLSQGRLYALRPGPS